MTAPDKSTDKPIHLVQYMVDTFGNWLNHWRELNELRQQLVVLALRPCIGLV